jgi:hypothetical protein
MGTKRDGMVPAKDLGFLDDEYRDSLEVGDSVPVVVLRTWGNDDENDTWPGI